MTSGFGSSLLESWKPISVYLMTHWSSSKLHFWLQHTVLRRRHCQADGARGRSRHGPPATDSGEQRLETGTLKWAANWSTIHFFFFFSCCSDVHSEWYTIYHSFEIWVLIAYTVLFFSSSVGLRLSSPWVSPWLACVCMIVQNWAGMKWKQRRTLCLIFQKSSRCLQAKLSCCILPCVLGCRIGIHFFNLTHSLIGTPVTGIDDLWPNCHSTVEHLSLSLSVMIKTKGTGEHQSLELVACCLSLLPLIAPLALWFGSAIASSWIIN